MGLLAGKTKLRRIVRWSKRHLKELQRYLPFPHGIPSVSTMSRVLSGVDEEMVSLVLMNWIGEINNTRGIHIAIDGKGLRAAARKIRDEKTPYVLNAIDVSSRLVIAQFVIQEKKNECTAIPELMERLEIEGSTITVDAIGATQKIMEAICGKGADFVLQVKKNCPALYDEIRMLFDGLSEESKTDPEEFQETRGSSYSETKTYENNRERCEYRKCQAFSDAELIKVLREERPYVMCVGLASQVRIQRFRDKDGNDITPGLKEFLEMGSPRQPRPQEQDGAGGDIQRAGLISSKVLNAEELMKYKRQHWAVENSLHYVLDETFGEDKSTIRDGKHTMSALRKCAYNICRLLQIENEKESPYIPDIIDDIRDDLEIGLKMIFHPIASFY